MTWLGPARRRGRTGHGGAGLTLAAIAIPEQMATARLGNFAPQVGLIVEPPYLGS
mgnify:CR=1 FL=1